VSDAFQVETKYLQFSYDLNNHLSRTTWEVSSRSYADQWVKVFDAYRDRRKDDGLAIEYFQDGEWVDALRSLYTLTRQHVAEAEQENFGK
jgi:hypothetical protein